MSVHGLAGASSFVELWITRPYGHTATRPHGHTAFSPVCVGRYETKCSGSVPFSYTATYKTACTPMEDYELEYLDRQNVACGRNQVKLPVNGPYVYTHMSVHMSDHIPSCLHTCLRTHFNTFQAALQWSMPHGLEQQVATKSCGRSRS